MGFTLTTHYCAGKQVKSRITLLDADLDCGMNHTKEPCDSSDSNKKVHKKNCCANNSIELNTIEDFQFSVEKLNISFVFLFSFFESYHTLVLQRVAASTFSYYPPPLYSNLDLQVLFQSFII